MMPDEWYYASGGEQIGPLPQARLQQLLASGQLRRADLVWTEGLAEWTAASKIAALNKPVSSPGSIRPAPLQSSPLQQPTQPVASSQPNAQPQPFGVSYASGQAGKSYSGFAMTSMICGISGFFFDGIGVGILLSITALIFGYIAISGMKSSQNPTGRGMAKAGVITAIVNLLLCIIVIILLVVVLVFWGSNFTQPG